MVAIQKSKESKAQASIAGKKDSELTMLTAATAFNKWIGSIPDEKKLEFGRSFIHSLIKEYWKAFYSSTDKFYNLPSVGKQYKNRRLDADTLKVAKVLGEGASKFSLINACYFIGNLYSSTVPQNIRSENGMFFTPPSLANRLLNLIELEGVNWDEVSILDPASGGGAFLVPTTLRILSSTNNHSDLDTIEHIENKLKGYELDFFSAWLSQVFIEVALHKKCLSARRRLKPVVEVCDTLVIKNDRKFDVIIGNPPYGKVKLTDTIRNDYGESLYGHANLYGLFTHFALKNINHNGIIAYVTPTSFLSGEYFKNLRKLLFSKTTIRSIDFVDFRKGVFEDVLQETMLTTYRYCKAQTQTIRVGTIIPDPIDLEVTELGTFNLSESSSIWLLPRSNSQLNSISSMEFMSSTLKDWGYTIKTGPLVWNRHKEQLADKATADTVPLIWAESITADGQFKWKADKKNHTLYFKIKKGNQSLLTNYSCILLQRTTSKEQQRRLIAALLPSSFLKTSKLGVVVENHINIVVPSNNKPKVSLKLLLAFLNSSAADFAFRCISGSVAVSAYELESMPLPAPELIQPLENLTKKKSDKPQLEAAFLTMYNLQS
jgi:adenine-specific DNA-methyltransferase